MTDIELLAVGADHAGFTLKTLILSHLKITFSKTEIIDCGCHSLESVDYPDVADTLTQKLLPVLLGEGLNPKGFGILICGSGQGMVMRANRHPGFRAGLGWNLEAAKLIREHNNANVLCLSARQVSDADNLAIVDTFLRTEFAQGRHQQRVCKLESSLAR